MAVRLTRYRQHLLKESVGFVALATFASAGFTAVAGVLVTRAVEPSQRGRIAAALAAGLLSTLLTTVGFESAVRVLLPRLDPAALRAEYRRVALFLIAGGLATGAAAGLYVVAVLADAGGADMGFLVAFVPVSTAAALARGAMYAEGRANLAAAGDAVGAAVQAAIVAVVAVVDPRVPLFYVAYLVGGLVPGAVYAVPLGKAGWLTPHVDGTNDERTSVRKALYREATKLFAGRLAMAMTYRLDRLLLAALSTAGQLGYYAAAVAVADVALLLPTAVSQVIWRRAAHHEQGLEEQQRILAPSMGAIAATGAVAVLIAVLSEPVVRLLYGSSYLPAASPLRVLALGAFFIAVWRVLATDLLARGFGRLFTVGAVASFIITVGLCAALIPAHGARGAAAASLVAYIVAAGLAVRWSRQKGVLRR